MRERMCPARAVQRGRRGMPDVRQPCPASPRCTDACVVLVTEGWEYADDPPGSIVAALARKPMATEAINHPDADPKKKYPPGHPCLHVYQRKWRVDRPNRQKGGERFMKRDPDWEAVNKRWSDEVGDGDE